ncbi:MAG: hypothetical protein WBF58_18360 [Xanthobacteraceae bacterium]
MCLACEQDAIWFDYLESQGLLKPDDPGAVEALFGAFPVQPLPMQAQQSEQPANELPAQVVKPNQFSCDDPTVSEADLKFLRAGRK